MPWDYSIYPELTKTQEHVFGVIGETIYMIQIAEHAIQNCMIFVFEQPDFLIENFYAVEQRERKKTLGYIITTLRSKAEIHPQFDGMLTAFVDKRNFFIHNLFNDKEYGLSTDEQCKKTESYLSDLQDYAWNIMNVFLSVLIEWSKTSGVSEHIGTLYKNPHLAQVEQKPFHLLIKTRDKNK